VLKKSFWGDERNFLGPMMPFGRGDVRDHIVFYKNDRGASYGRYAVLQWWSQLKISFCEIFGVVQFPTFATLSAKSGSLCILSFGCNHLCFSGSHSIALRQKSATPYS
jgi:hypothetical protein